VHDLGPEIRRAISGNLEEEELVERRRSEEPMHRVSSAVTAFICLLLCAGDKAQETLACIILLLTVYCFSWLAHNNSWQCQYIFLQNNFLLFLYLILALTLSS